MITARSKYCLTFFLLVCFLAVFHPLSAQTIWLNQQQYISLEVLKPDLDGPDHTTKVTSTSFLTLRLPITESFKIIGELPFVHSQLTFDNSIAQNDIGNPYLGIEFGKPESPIFTELGIRLPFAQSLRLPLGASSRPTTLDANTKPDKLNIGFFSDVDRLEAFAVDNLSLFAALNFQPGEWWRLFKYRLRFGSSFLFDTEKSADTDIFLLFSGQLGYESEMLEILLGISSRFRLTSDNRLGRRSFMQLGFSANYNLGLFRPGLLFKLPLEADLQENLDFVFGLSLGVNL